MLPNTYYQLEYLEGTGTQYINIGLDSTLGYEYELKARYTTDDNQSGLVGRSQSGHVESIYRTSSKAVVFGILNVNTTVSDVAKDTDYVYKFSSIYSNCYIDFKGQEYHPTVLDSGVVNLNSYMFAININGTAGYFGKARIYYCKIKDSSSELVRDFVPAMRVSDGVVGMYDLVNDVFYTNAGSGTFVYGASIDVSKVTQNFTSYTFSEKGLYVFTGSVDGGYDIALGGTATQLYYKHSYAGTVALLWAENGQTLITNKQNHCLLCKVSGYNSAPKIKYSTEGTGTISVSGKKNNVYIGMAVGHWHGDTTFNYSFSCSGVNKTISHSSAGWSKNAMSLMIPTSDSTVSVTTSGATSKHMGYLVQLSSDNIFMKVSGSWKEGTTYIKTNGQWKQGEVKVKHTTWKGS